ncbi:MAG: hypothetical protein AAB453_04550 [Patescibacteria group bacterium]|mgnify:CR=1 FL=1
MSSETILKCDCGCGAEARSDQEKITWFEFRQHWGGGGISKPENAPKIDGGLYFYTLDCLKRWLEAAEIDLPEMQKIARTLNPRSQIRSTKAFGLYV